MGFSTIAAVAAPVVGGLIGADASRSAANTQADAARYGADIQKQMFEENKASLSPWVGTGTMAMSDLAKFAGVTGSGIDMNAPGAQMFSPSNFFLDPSYSFIKGQQEEGLMNQASAMGGTLSGNTLRALGQYDTGLASTEYNNAFNRWNTMINNIFNRVSSISGAGENAAGMTSNLGAQTGANLSETAIGGANALASGQVGSANAIAGGLGGAFNNYLLNKMITSNPNVLSGGAGTGGTYGGYSTYDLAAG